MSVIGMVLDDHYPPDIRVTKEAYTLIKGGHQVHLLCARRNTENDFEVIDGLSVHRIDVAKNKVQKGLWDILLSLTFLHPIFLRQIKKFCRKNNIGILHIHDLPLCKTGIVAGNKLKIPVICDFHENYPEGLRVWYKWRSNPIIILKNKIFFGFSRWKKYEKWVSKNASHIIAVVDEMKEKLINDFQISPEKITVVTNSESVNFINQPREDNVYKSIDSKFILAYLGNVGPHRGVDTVLEGLSYLEDLDIKFVIVGGIKTNVQNILDALIKKFGVEDKVQFFGYQPFNKFYSYMSNASANVIPHNFNGHTNNTVPHKLFQSMMAGKPLIVSSCKPLKRIVNNTNSGLVFEADNARDFARCVRELYNDKNLREKFGENGRQQSISGEYNWEVTAHSLMKVYQNLDQ